MATGLYPTVGAFIKASRKSDNPHKCIRCGSPRWRDRVRAACCQESSICTDCVKRALHDDQKCPYCKEVMIRKPRSMDNAASAPRPRQGPAPSSSAPEGQSPTLPRAADPQLPAAARQAARRDNSLAARRAARATIAPGTPGASSEVIDLTSESHSTNTSPAAASQASAEVIDLTTEANPRPAGRRAHRRDSPPPLPRITPPPAPRAPSRVIDHTSEPSTAEVIEVPSDSDDNDGLDLEPPPTPPSAADVGFDAIDWDDDSEWTPAERLTAHLANFGVRVGDLAMASGLKDEIPELRDYDFGN